MLKSSICGIRTHALSADDLKSPPLTARARYFLLLVTHVSRIHGGRTMIKYGLNQMKSKFLFGAMDVEFFDNFCQKLRCLDIRDLIFGICW